MSHPLQQRIDALRSRVARLSAIRGLGLIVAAVLATLIVLGSIDYWVRFHDRGVLVVFALAVLGVFAWTGYLAVRRFLAARLDDTDLALHVESYFPAVQDRLTSAVEFLRQPEDNAIAGSAALRRAAISQAVAASEDLDFTTALDRRPAMRAGLAAFLLVVAAACLILANATAARTALARLAFPLGTVDWPQQTHLGLRQPIKPIVRGQPLEVEVIDMRDAPLPRDCRIRYRLTDVQRRIREESEPMQMLGKMMVARRENVTLPLAFCFTGGDDRNKHWYEVQVVDPPEPPTVLALTLKITPPSYTNWPDEDRDATSTLPLLAGSRVQLAGKATKRLTATSELRLDDGRAFPLQIEHDGVTFHVGSSSSRAQAGAPLDLILEKSTGYSLHLVDVDGVEGGGDEKWLFRVLTDAPPTVVIEQPAGDLFVTEQAKVSFRIRARDDMALRKVSMVLGWPDKKAAKERTLSLFQGPEKPPNSSSSAFDAGSMGEEKTFDLPAQQLSEFQLSPGMQLTCYATATDYHLQTGRSDPRILTVITPDQLLERLAVRQNQVLAELARVLQLQHAAREQVRALEIRLHESVDLEQADIDRLQTAEFNQREVVRSLTSSSDGLPKQLLGMLADLETNRIDNPDFQRRLEGLLAELDRLRRDQLPPIGPELTAAIKGSQVRLQSAPRPVGRDVETESHLALAGKRQQEVIAALEGMLVRMRQWDDYRRFHREVAELLRDQEEAAGNTTALGTKTIGRDLKELPPQESADLKILAEHQLELARRETRLEAEMEQTSTTLGQSEPMAAETLNDAVAEARRLAIAGDMSAAGGKIQANGLGLAPAVQQRVLQNLQEVRDILANNRRQELARLARKLGEADKDLILLRKQQEGLRRKIEESVGQSGGKDPKSEKQKAELQKLAREQEKLRQQTQQFSRRLERLMAEEAANAAEKAAESMAQGGRAGDTGDGHAAGRGAKQAESDLEVVSRLLAARRFEIEAQLAMEEQARFADTIKHLHAQEERIAVGTREFADLQRGGALDRVEVDSLMRLAHQQELLRDETGRVIESLGAADIFRVGLAVAVDEMGRASALLERRQTGTTTQEAEQFAIDRLKLLLAALEPEKPGGADDKRGPDNQGADKRNGEPSAGVLPLAQLKLLKLLQEDLNLRTQQLNSAEAAGKASEELRQQYARLLEEQGRLAELASQLLRPKPPENGQPPEGANEPNEPKELKELKEKGP